MENGQYLSEFETHLLTEKRASKNTFSAYQTDLRQFYDYLAEQDLQAATCTVKDLKAYVRSLHKQKMAARTLSRKISTLKAFYTFLHDRYTVDNAAKGLVFPKIEKKLPTYLTEEEVLSLLDVAREDATPKGVRNLVMLHVLYAGGMRISELVNLTLDAVHFDTGFLSITGKGNKQRDVPLPHSVLTTLSYYVNTMYPRLVSDDLLAKARPFLFPTVRNNKLAPITRQSFWNILSKLLKKACITKQVSPHTLRHSLATHLLNAGADVRSLQLLLGHEQVNTVEIYTHLQNKQLRKIYDHKHPRA